jgi:hypothetical protein
MGQQVPDEILCDHCCNVIAPKKGGHIVVLTTAIVDPYLSELPDITAEEAARQLRLIYEQTASTPAADAIREVVDRRRLDLCTECHEKYKKILDGVKGADEERT